MLQRLLNLDDRLEKAERILAVTFYLLLIAAIAFNVVARNVLHTGSAFLLHAAPTLVLWLALVGATLALKHRRHITIGLLMRLLPPAWRSAANRLTSLFAMVLSGILCYTAVVFVTNEIALFGAWGWRSVCFPVFFLIVCLRYALRLVSPKHLFAGWPSK